MKETYKRAELEIYEFSDEDILTGSDNDPIPEDDELPGRGVATLI